MATNTPPTHKGDAMYTPRSRQLNPAPQPRGLLTAAPHVTHEEYIHAVRGVVLPYVVNPISRQRIATAKLVYGAGAGTGARGVTYFSTWQGQCGSTGEVVEVCAFGEESALQVAGTTVHELAHVLAGHKAGHDKEWKHACAELGLTHAEAAGQSYAWEHFRPEVRATIQTLTPRPMAPRARCVPAGSPGHASPDSPAHVARGWAPRGDGRGVSAQGHGSACGSASVSSRSRSAWLATRSTPRVTRVAPRLHTLSREESNRVQTWITPPSDRVGPQVWGVQTPPLVCPRRVVHSPRESWGGQVKAVVVSVTVGMLIGLAIVWGLGKLLPPAPSTPRGVEGVRASVGCIAHVGGVCRGWAL